MKRYTLLLANSITNELANLRGDLVPKTGMREKKESKKKRGKKRKREGEK